MAASPSLQDTVDRVLARAQRVLASAKWVTASTAPLGSKQQLCSCCIA